MPLYQYSLYFRSTSTGQGWAERVVMNPSSDSAVTPGDNVLNWANARAVYLSSDNLIIGWARERIDGTRSAKSVLFNPPVPGQVAEKDNQPGDCLDFRFFVAGNASARTYQMRGIPDSWISSGQLTPVGAGQANNAVSAYFTNFLMVGSYLSLRSGYSQTTYTPISGFTAVASGPNLPPYSVTVALTNVVTWPIGVNSYFQIKSVKGYPYISGRWKGMVVTNTTVSIPGLARYNPPITGHGGQITLISPAGITVSSVVFDRLSYRRCGAPFDRQRGRRSAKLLHTP